MKLIILLLSFTAVGIVLAACGDTSVNVNTNRLANTTANVANTVANTASNAVNTVVNAINNATTNKPADFMTEAAQGGMAEVEMGKLAASKAQNAEVKKFGQMMVDDHTKINTEMKALAAKKNVTLPTDIGSHKSPMDKLSGLSGADFDRDYVRDMVNDHQDDVAAFQKQADTATDADLKAFAAKTLPILKKHLDAINAIQAKMK